MTRVSPEVYRRRRIVVFGGLLLVILLIVFGLFALTKQLGGGTGTPPGPTDPPSTGEPGENTAEACLAGNILVEPITDKTTYSAGEYPQMSMRITNRGPSDCTINIGTATQVYTVTSGSDTWWVSTHCQTESSDLDYTLSAGQVMLSAGAVEWGRVRSSPDTCSSTNRPAAPGGGASYHVSVEIGGFKSESTKQIILN